MGFSWKVILSLLVMVFVVMTFYNLVIKIYVLPKIKINKWIILALGIIMFFVTNIIGANLKISYNKFGLKELPYYLCMALFILFFFMFFDLMGWGAASTMDKKKSKSDIVIRPKAKPNRIKNKDKKK
ncbi:hypothetical protein [Clostridium guangxiense]|uniref:hypothetical protein n=1 Tax=Clostridium guangxiense TaxID=1662055 RepID=UPI001E40D7BE|nr:hypothetical protein [Clostridium guangxiense]MCD2348628.1 hypothetical protein [Clostridium guangxiense]